MTGCERIDWRKFEKRISYTKRQDPEGYWYDFKLKYSLPPTDATSSHYDLHSTYEHFDTVCHVTSLKNAMQIITEGHFKLQIVSGDSVVTGKTLPLNGIQCKQPLHPISNVPVIWYGPWKKSKIGSPDITVERYGNVVFSMKSLTGFEGIIRSGLNCYFIEEIQYKKSTASRIFISEKTYSGLRSYDPFVIGGPWYIEKKTGHYFRKDRTLEILREPALGNHYEWWLDNHEVSFSYCSNPRYGVAAVLKPANVSENELQEDYSLQTMRLSFCLKRQQTFRFADNIKQKLYSDLLALHKKALSEKGCKIDLMILERGFTNMFMDPSIKDVVSLYRSYLHYIRLVSDIKDEDQNELFEQILKNLGVSNPKPSSGEEDFSSYSQK